MMKNISGDIATFADDLQEAAEEMFVGGTRFTNVTVWDDGDFSIKIQHTFDPVHSTEVHREVVEYHHSEDERPVYRIDYKWYEELENGMHEPRTKVLRETPLDRKI